MRKIYVVGPDSHYINWMEGNLTSSIEQANFVVFTGGEDISPYLYDDNSHPSTWSAPVRDEHDLLEYNKAKSLKIPVVGICRGSQLLCVISGGKLIQDQADIERMHLIECVDGQHLLMNSMHHQAQYPFLLPAEQYKLLAWTKGISSYHKNGNDKEMHLPDGKEAEIVYYPKINGLGIQGHPEIMMKDYGVDANSTKTIDYLRELLNRFLNCQL